MSEAFSDKPPICSAEFPNDPLSPHTCEQLACAADTGQSSSDVRLNCSDTMHQNLEFCRTEIQSDDIKHDRHHQAAPPASLTQLRDIAQETGDILSRLKGWQRISLRPQPGTSIPNTGRPAFINVSRSAYTRLNFNSSEAQTLLKNISMIGKALDNVSVQLAPQKTPAELVRGLKRSSFESSCSSASSSIVPASSEVSSSATLTEEHQTVQENVCPSSSFTDCSCDEQHSCCTTNGAVALCSKDVEPTVSEIGKPQEAASLSLDTAHDSTNTAPPQHVEYADLKSGSGSVFADILKCLGFNFGLPADTALPPRLSLPQPQHESDSFNSFLVTDRRSSGITSSPVEGSPDKFSGEQQTDGEAESPDVIPCRHESDTSNSLLSRQDSNTSSLSPVDASSLTKCRTQAFESMSLQAHRHTDTDTKKTDSEYKLSQRLPSQHKDRSLSHERTQEGTNLVSSRRGRTSRCSRNSLESQSSLGRRKRSPSVLSISSSSSNSGKKSAEREVRERCKLSSSHLICKTRFTRSRSSSLSSLDSVQFSTITKPLVLEKYSPKADTLGGAVTCNKSTIYSLSQSRSSLDSVEFSPIAKSLVLEKCEPMNLKDRALKHRRRSGRRMRSIISLSQSKSRSLRRSRSARSRSAHSSTPLPQIVEQRNSPKRNRSVAHSKSSKGSVCSRRSSCGHERSKRSISSSRSIPSAAPRCHGRASPRDRSRSRSPLDRPIASPNYSPIVPVKPPATLLGPPPYVMNRNPCVIYPSSVLIPNLPAAVYPMYTSSSSRMQGFGCEVPLGNGTRERSQWDRLTDEFLYRSRPTEKADHRSDWNRSTEEFLNRLNRPVHYKKAHDA